MRNTSVLTLDRSEPTVLLAITCHIFCGADYLNFTGTIHASFDSRWSVIPSGCRTGLERSTATHSERTLSFHLLPRTEDHSVPVVVPWCDLLYLRARRSVLICHHLLVATNWFHWHCTVVLQQQCDNATHSFLPLLLYTTTRHAFSVDVTVWCGNPRRRVVGDCVTRGTRHSLASTVLRLLCLLRTARRPHLLLHQQQRCGAV